MSGSTGILILIPVESNPEFIIDFNGVNYTELLRSKKRRLFKKQSLFFFYFL